jgi:hypothetical protein
MQRDQSAARGASSHDAVEALRTTCWRQANEIASQAETISVLRAGANTLAIDRALLQAEVESLRDRHDGAHEGAVRLAAASCRGLRRRRCRGRTAL